MSYLTINTDVDINFDEISDDDLMEIIEYKVKLYKKKNDPKYLKDLRFNIREALRYDTVGEPADEEGTVQDWLKNKVVFELVTKYTLNELEIFLNKA
jgi:hypothetical protein